MRALSPPVLAHAPSWCARSGPRLRLRLGPPSRRADVFAGRLERPRGGCRRCAGRRAACRYPALRGRGRLVDYGAALEMRFGATHRGFESRPLRHTRPRAMTPDARVVACGPRSRTFGYARSGPRLRLRLGRPRARADVSHAPGRSASDARLALDHGPDRRRLRAAARFGFPSRSSRGGVGVVMGFAIRHPEGVIVVDTGFGFGHPELDLTTSSGPWRILDALARHRGPASGRRPRSSTATCMPTTPARTPRSRACRSTSSRPNGGWPTTPTTRSSNGSTSTGADSAQIAGDHEVRARRPGRRRPRATRPATSRSRSTTADGPIVLAGQACYTAGEWDGDPEALEGRAAPPTRPPTTARSSASASCVRPASIFGHDRERWTAVTAPVRGILPGPC